MPEEPPRTLILGSQDHGRNVRAFSWTQIPEGLNVADFEFVILNLAEFDDESIRTNMPSERVPSAEQFARLIFSEGSAVVAIGDPAIEFGRPEPLFGGGQPIWTSRSGTWWLPVELPVKVVSGETIDKVKPRWEFWFEHVRRYDWHFWNRPEAAHRYKQDAAQSAAPWADGFIAGWEALATTRYGDPLGISLNISAVKLTKHRSQFSSAEYRTEDASAEVYWLPPPTEITQHEAIDLLLRDVGIKVEAQLPEWLEGFLLPEHRRTLETVSLKFSELETAQQGYVLAKETAGKQARFERLLFEQGKDALEPVVREALERLGARVTEPTRGGIEDGRLVDPKGRAAMLEIKGRRGQLKLEDVRQLDGWTRTAIAEEGWNGKGLLVANLKLEEPPDQRLDLVAPNALAFAQRVGIVIVTTAQVHEALRELETGTFDNDAFWDTLFSTNGPVVLTQPTRR